MSADPRAYQPYLQGAVNSFDQTRPHRVPAPRRRAWGRLTAAVLGLGLGLSLAVYLLLPIRSNILLLGIDSRPQESQVSRTDTMILTTVIPTQPYVGMLSIPRDLWVTVPGVGENRINTAHFFAENAAPGSGPEAAKQTVSLNFGVDVPYYVRIRFEGLRRFVDALGGVEVDLPTAMAGYEPGRHLLTGEQALAFVRDRKGTDDFFRMQRGQVFLQAVVRRAMTPWSWARVPAAAAVLLASIDTDLPVLLWPQIGFALLRAGPAGIDGRTMTREMAQGFTTGGGAAVLAPRWEAINPVLLEMFGQ
ncbi:MAG: LCP family protein [Anaerolineales bacterium]|nr:LCP family protein [Anaerolineales bacterium]